MNDKSRNKRILAILLVLLMLLGGAGAILSVTDAKETADNQDGESTTGASNAANDHDAISRALTENRERGAAFGQSSASGSVENVIA